MAFAIYESTIPVISAVGHEPDVTISDYVADLRAATPSNAAELAVPDQAALRQSLDAMTAAMATVLMRQLKASRKHLDMLRQSPCLSSPMGYINQRREKLNGLTQRLIAAQNAYLGRRRQQYIALSAKLDAMSPLKVLTRGYAITQTESGAIIRSVSQVTPGDPVTISLTDGAIHASVTEVKENPNE